MEEEKDNPRIERWILLDDNAVIVDLLTSPLSPVIAIVFMR